MFRSSLSPEQRRLRAQMAANERWARHDPKPALAKTRQGFQRYLEDQVDPDRTLPEAERQRRARAAMRAHMARMAFESSKARRRKAAES